MTSAVEFALDTFGDVTVGLDDSPVSQAQVIRNLVAEAVLADELGVNFFGVGEHYRVDFAVSSPEAVLAGIATVTKHIHLGSAVTVLSSDDLSVCTSTSPLSTRSRTAGPRSFSVAYPSLNPSRCSARTSARTRCSSRRSSNCSPSCQRAAGHLAGHPACGPHRPGRLSAHRRGHLKTWVGVGGSPESVVRAATHSFPLVLAINGGGSARFPLYVDLFHRALAQLEKPDLPIAVHSPGYIADTDAEAAAQYFLHQKAMRDSIGIERSWAPSTRTKFENEIEHGSLYLGSLETVALKLATTIKTLGVQRFDMKYSAGTLPHELMMQPIELYGARVIPMVRDLLS